MSLLTDLHQSLPGSSLKTIAGIDRCIVDILTNETLEVFEQPGHDGWLVLESVYMACDGTVGRTIVAVVRGNVLVPSMIDMFALVRERQVQR